MNILTYVQEVTYYPCVQIRIHISSKVICYSLQPRFHLADRKHCIFWGHTKGKTVKKGKTSICYAGISTTI